MDRAATEEPSGQSGSRDSSPESGVATTQVPNLSSNGNSDLLSIEIKGLSFGYSEAITILEDIDLDVQSGEILILIGPSGCGKSTLLNHIAGIIAPSKGTVATFGQPVHGLNRRVTYMTQKDTLLPWRNGIDNAALPLEIKGVSKEERYERARTEMARVGIPDAENRKPHELSGGMRSRLSLARALLSDTDIFLMDEPFAAIDALRRVHLQQLLLDVWQETHKTMVYVTHDLDEAIALGHRIIVMSSHPGRIFMERRISVPQPRDVVRFRNTPEAESLHVELWNALEQQFVL